jgi:hypothetical protein
MSINTKKPTKKKPTSKRKRVANTTQDLIDKKLEEWAPIKVIPPADVKKIKKGKKIY